jgi:tRNA threonylcarbamoyladenosine biosynthesis protein TsaE
MHSVSQSAQETQAIAAQLARRIFNTLPGAQAKVIALYGELGAGKTTFAQGFAQELGIIEKPKSPTFALVKMYAIPQTSYRLWHLDCYRLEGHRDLVSLDLHHEFENPLNIMLIEWPERIGESLPADRIDIRFAHTGADHRSITIEEYPKRS